MKNNHKIFMAIPAAAAALLAVSCHKADEAVLTPIVFGSPEVESVTESATRAVDNQKTFTFKSGDRIGVFACYHTSSQTGFKPNFMFNQLVQYNGSKWSYSPLKYWPNGADDKVAFIAYYPYTSTTTATSEAGKVSLEDYSNGASALPQLKYTAPTASSAQQEIMMSSETDLSKQAVNSSVAFNFKHILAKVVLQFDYSTMNSEAATDFKIKSLTVSGLRNSGIFNPSTSAWSSQAGDVTFTVDECILNGTTATLPGTVSSLTATGDYAAFLMIPGTYAANAVQIDIAMSYTKGGTSYDITGNTKLGAVTWAPGKKYTYKVKFTPAS